jgi:DNA invertase Pin-like site-specific DNA recombinase
MRRIADAFSEYERLMIGLRTRAALRAKRARGQLAGATPYGFRAGIDKTLQPNDDERHVLAVIQECREARYSLRDIAEELNRRGHRTRRGSPWRFEYVRSIAKTIDRNAGIAR